MSNKTATAILHTNHGDIAIDLFGNHAPKTVENFIGLAKGTKDYSQPNAAGENEGGSTTVRSSTASSMAS